jgi:hypothetical protein
MPLNITLLSCGGAVGRYGRLRMQSYGFVMMFVLFLICAVGYNTLTASQTGLKAFQFLYFFSSFWNQFGPNCTTWLVAGEGRMMVHWELLSLLNHNKELLDEARRAQIDRYFGISTAVFCSAGSVAECTASSPT